jgi:2-C-methyl-D-erythritol 4-phosphate cytidylyltransferase / 2-C-methyl-D-erythritol 2,4-cyclodiphosphate synthase
MYITAIVPAAGTGSRLRDKRFSVPKQFWPLCELERSVHIRQIIICTDKKYRPFFQTHIIKKNGLKKVRAIVSGGRTRADSVKNGLAAIGRATTHVLIQDAVRPFIDGALIERLVKAVPGCEGVIAARAVTPTIKKVSRSKITATIDRSALWEAQTPQIFRAAVLKKAYTRLKDAASLVTDEASLVEALGATVKVVDSKMFNLKITTPADYELARRVVEGTMRKVGFGYDIHRLVEGRALMLGGVKIPFHKGPLGHSDGDPVLHAIIDAVLGAAALGDIGEMFPDTDTRYKNIASDRLLGQLMKVVKEKGLEIENVDVTIILERPTLTKHKPAITKRLMQLLGLTSGQVNVKAKTKEGLDSEGSGCAVSCYAVLGLRAWER